MKTYLSSDRTRKPIAVCWDGEYAIKRLAEVRAV